MHQIRGAKQGKLTALTHTILLSNILTPELCEDLEEKVYITGDTVCHHRRKRLDKCVHSENSLQKLQSERLLVR
jgi:hypothetical protein